MARNESKWFLNRLWHQQHTCAGFANTNRLFFFCLCTYDAGSISRQPRITIINLISCFFFRFIPIFAFSSRAEKIRAKEKKTKKRLNDSFIVYNWAIICFLLIYVVFATELHKCREIITNFARCTNVYNIYK